MNDLTCDIGYKSINHAGEQLCGDHVEVVEQEDGSTVIVLADGLGSGVKASILSTLTSKIISTMLAAGLSIEDCVETIAATLPVCSVRGVAYSTFTIIRLIRNQTAELIQYDNPQVIMLRNGENFEYPRTEATIGGKKVPLQSLKVDGGLYGFVAPAQPEEYHVTMRYQTPYSTISAVLWIFAVTMGGAYLTSRFIIDVKKEKRKLIASALNR